MSPKFPRSMTRREFMVAGGTAAMGAAMAGIIPGVSNRAQADPAPGRIQHVVFVHFGGGTRLQESIYMEKGNLMPNIFGVQPGDPQVSTPVQTAMDERVLYPAPRPDPLILQGAMMTNVRYRQGALGHYQAIASSITGTYNQGSEKGSNSPEDPTVFEYLRKGTGAASTDAWFLTRIAGSYSFLNKSQNADYGVPFAGNLIYPAAFMSGSFSGLLNRHANRAGRAERDAVQQLTQMIDSNFVPGASAAPAGGINTPDQSSLVEQLLESDLINSTNEELEAELPGFQRGSNGNFFANQDMLTAYSAVRILKTFHPKVLGLTLFDVDGGHSSFTSYALGIKTTDYLISYLWDQIQSDDTLRDNTVLIAQPEIGRDAQENGFVDASGERGTDHADNSDSCRQVFSLILGPADVMNSNTTIDAPHETVDIVPTIGSLLGFDVPLVDFRAAAYTEAFA